MIAAAVVLTVLLFGGLLVANGSRTRAGACFGVACISLVLGVFAAALVLVVLAFAIPADQLRGALPIVPAVGVLTFAACVWSVWGEL